MISRKYMNKTSSAHRLKVLKLAIDKIRKKKLSYRQAADKYSVPKSTLCDMMKKDTIEEPKRGRKPIFNVHQEKELEQFVLDRCRLFYGLTISTLRKIAFDFATANGIPNNFNTELKLAGIDWYQGFLARHPHISIRRPEASLNRFAAINKEEIDRFFNDLHKLITKFRFDADNIFNVDETSVGNVQRNCKILAPRGQKQVGKCIGDERGSWTTVVNAFSAGGTYVPPFFIFKRKRMNRLLMKNSDDNMVATVSKNGGINEGIFVDWLHHFVSFVKPSKASPVLLILDNHQSHISLDAYKICRDNEIHVVSLPPHASRRMQPLDLTLHGPLKTAYSEECGAYVVNNPGVKITDHDIVGLYKKAFNRVANVVKASSGFETAGIHPFDPQKFQHLFPVSVQEDLCTDL